MIQQQGFAGFLRATLRAMSISSLVRTPRAARLLLVLVLTVGAVGAVIRSFPWDMRESDVGKLPPHVHRSDLNLIVITLDTLRADRLGSYGSNRGLTPNLDRLADEGVLFQNATTVAPLTLPAHTSLFTGRLPPAHGVRENAHALREGTDVQTLAETLRGSGFTTAAFVSAGVLDASRGLNRGFADYDAVPPRRDAYGRVYARRRADEVVLRAMQWINGVADSRFFAWLHLYDAHAPYDPPDPYRKTHRSLYDGSVAFVDAQIGQFLDMLGTRGLLDRTIVVIVSDHGESLGDHGEETHGLFVYESVLHVPLIIRTPFSALRGRRVTSLARSIDVMPTVLELLDVRFRGRIEGDSLVSLVTKAGPQREAYAENLYPQLQFGWSSLRALRTERFKLIVTARPELYDLQVDPNEQRNLFASRPEVVKEMLERLRAAEKAVVAPVATQRQATGPGLRERLVSLGYVSGVSDPAKRADAGRDPKDMVVVFNRMASRTRLRGRADTTGSSRSASEVLP